MTSPFADMAFLTILPSIFGRWRAAFRHQGRLEALGRPVFTLRRALVAYPKGRPHYFVEVDDGGLRPRLVLHVTGKPLHVWEPDPETERPRFFPAARFEVVPGAETKVVDGCLRSYTILCLGDAVEPIVAEDARWLERLGESLLTNGVEECDKLFEEYLRLGGCTPGNDGTDRSRAATASTPGSWRLAARRALRVEGEGSGGLHYYMELGDSRVLHLSGYGLRAFEPVEDQPRVFPCDLLAPLYPPRSFIEWPEGVECIGTPFEPDLAGRRLKKADRREGWVPRDWGRLDRAYEEVVAHFGAVPAQAPPDFGPPAERQPPSRPDPTAAVEPLEATVTTPIDQPPPLSEPLFSTSFDDDFAVDDKDRHER